MDKVDIWRGMDKTVDFYTLLAKELEAIYDPREANNIATFVFEDLFGVHQPIDTNQSFSKGEQEQFGVAYKRLLTGEPWQYIVGEADFYGFKFNVNNAVLIPRPETEELVHLIIQQHKKRTQPYTILDIGTGSGCIAVTLQKSLPEATVTAIDLSDKALAVAKSNAEKHAVSLQIEQIDILDEEATKKMPQYHIIVSNPPYIKETEEHLMPQHVLAHEPSMALFVTNDDPLQFYNSIANFACKHLKPAGYLYFEINEHYGKEVLEMLQNKGFVDCQLEQDMFGRDRIVWGRMV